MKRIFCFVLISILTHCVWAQGSGEGYDPGNPADPNAYYTLEVVASPTKAGTVSPAKKMLPAGASVNCSATANTGYTFKQWRAGDEVVSTERSMYYTMPDHNVVLTAEFEFTGYDPENPGDPDHEEITHYVYLSANPENAGYFYNSKLKLEEGESTQVRAYSKENWTFESWTSDGVVVSTDNPMTVVMGNKSLSFTAQFRFDPSSPGDPSPNFFDPETGLLVIYSFSPGYLSSAISQTMGDYPYSEIKKAVIIGGMSSVDFGFAQYFTNCKVIDISSTTGYTKIADYGFNNVASLEEIFLPDCITEIGNNVFSGCSSLNAIVLPEGVTSIGSAAFSGCSSLASIIIPEGVTTIGGSAFSSCKSLASINIPSGVTSIEKFTFDECHSLTSLVLPDGITYIRNAAFQGCTSLTSINIPDGVTIIEEYTFSGCSSLASIVFPAGVSSIGENAFNSCYGLADITNLADTPQEISENVFSNYDATLHVKHGLQTTYKAAPVWQNFFKVIDDADGDPTVLPENFEYDGLYYNKVSETTVEVTNGPVGFKYSGDIVVPERAMYEGIEAEVVGIGEYAFWYCPDMTSINIPSSVTYIAPKSFAGCSSLTSLVIPETVTTIGEYAFSDCTNLSSINIPSGVTQIESNIFHACSSLTSLVLPDGVTSIGSRAFDQCTNLTSINIPSGVTAIEHNTFYGCSSLTSLELPEGVTSIGYGAFHDCENLTSLTLPEGVTFIDQLAFSGCTNLTSINIPSGVTSIEFRTFYECTSLSSIIIPAGVGSIEEKAFSGCTSLADITNLADVPQEIREDVFSNYDATLHVKHGLQTTYKAAPVWQNFFKVIDDADGDPTPTELPDNFYYDGLYYNKVSESTVEVAQVPEYTENYSGDVVIPAKAMYEGLEATVVGIGQFAFYGCENLSSISMAETVTYIGQQAFDYCENLAAVDMSENITSIANAAFFYCHSLKTMTVPAGVMVLAEGVFANCSELTSVSLPEGLTSIGNSAFSGCFALTDIEIPAGVTHIGESAFTRCESLTSVVIPEGITKIEDGTFRECGVLASVTLPSTLTEIGIFALGGCAFTTIDIPATVNSIGRQAFIGSKLTSVVIPEGITTIELETFQGCTSLASVTLPSTLTTIGVRAFGGCPLATITIPAGVTTIESGAFVYDHITDVTNLADVPQEIPEDAFNTYDATLHVKHGLHTTYKEAPVWQNFFKVIDDADGNPTPDPEPFVEVDLDEPGTLENEIWYPEIVEGLTITGPINGTDVNYIRTKLPELRFLNIEGAWVVEGGSAYYSTLSADSTGVDAPLYTSNYTIGDYMFSEMPRLHELMLCSNTKNIGKYFIAGSDNLFRIEIPQQVTNVADGALSGIKRVMVQWNADNAVVTDGVSDNPNLIIYATQNYKGNAARENLVVGEVAENIVLHEGNNLFIPMEFRARQASYTRTFSKQTQRGTSAGWESIVLPFDVINVVSEQKGRIAPFGSDEATDKHFYLARLGDNGFEMASELSANVPYIVSMPNSPEYAEQYNITGRVMFYAKSESGIRVMPTDDAEESQSNAFTFVPTYEKIQATPNFYVLNEEVYNGYMPGSVFLPNVEVEPFHPFVVDTSAHAPAYIPVFEGDVTAIMPILDMKPSRTDDAVYDLMGIRQDPNHLQKGKVYIVKGRKKVAPSPALP